jgi:F420-0:gamma-glutamyl ligase-like protein
VAHRLLTRMASGVGVPGRLWGFLAAARHRGSTYRCGETPGGISGPVAGQLVLELASICERIARRSFDERELVASARRHLLPLILRWGRESSVLPLVFLL